jgi:hypothetical protein
MTTEAIVPVAVRSLRRIMAYLRIIAEGGGQKGAGAKSRVQYQCFTVPVFHTIAIAIALVHRHGVDATAEASDTSSHAH